MNIQSAEQNQYVLAKDGQKILGVDSGKFFYYVQSGQIKKEPSEKKRGARYSVEDILRVKGKLAGKQGNTKTVYTHIDLPKEEIKAQISLFQEEDKPSVYFMESELLTVKKTLSPDTIWSWQKKNDHVYWLLHNPLSRREARDIWGTLGVVPLQEDTIFRVLKGERNIQDISASEILNYEQNHAYSCLITSMVVRPERRIQFNQLIESLLDYWSELSLNINKVYAFASTGTEGTFPLRLVRELGFMLRTDIIGSQPVWELDFGLWNPFSPIQHFIKEQRENQMISLQEKTHKKAKVAPTHYIQAKTEEEIGATVDIDNEIFGISDIPREKVIAVRQDWLQEEPETIYVLKANDVVIGYHAMVALPIEKILNILRETDRPINIHSNDIFPYRSGRELDVYIVVTGLKPGLTEKEEGIYSASLMRGIMHQFENFGHHGVVIRRVFGRSRTPEGIKRMKDMGFQELDFSPIHGKQLFSIDVATSNEPFIKSYKQALDEHRSATHP